MIIRTSFDAFYVFSLIKMQLCMVNGIKLSTLVLWSIDKKRMCAAYELCAYLASLTGAYIELRCLRAGFL